MGERQEPPRSDSNSEMFRGWEASHRVIIWGRHPMNQPWASSIIRGVGPPVRARAAFSHHRVDNDDAQPASRGL